MRVVTALLELQHQLCVLCAIGSGCQLASSTVALSWPARFAFPVKEKSASSRPPHCRIAKRLVIATSEPQERSLSRSASVKGSTEQRQRRACFFSSSGFGGRPRERLAPLVAAPAAAGDDIEHQFRFFVTEPKRPMSRALRTYVRPVPLPKGSARF